VEDGEVGWESPLTQLGEKKANAKSKQEGLKREGGCTADQGGAGVKPSGRDKGGIAIKKQQKKEREKKDHQGGEIGTEAGGPRIYRSRQPERQRQGDAETEKQKVGKGGGPKKS